MTTIEYPTFHDALAEQQLADGFATEGLRLARERDAARKALRLEREDHAATKRDLQLARLEIARLARHAENLERQIDQAQQAAAAAPPDSLPYLGRQL